MLRQLFFQMEAEFELHVVEEQGALEEVQAHGDSQYLYAIEQSVTQKILTNIL